MTNSYFFDNKGQKKIRSNEVFTSNEPESKLLRLVSPHEVGSLALETAIAEVRALQMEG